MTNWMSAGALGQRGVQVGAHAHRAVGPLPVVPSMAAIRSSQTPVEWFAIRLPPGSPSALAFHSGFT